MSAPGDDRRDARAASERAARLNSGADRDWGLGRVVLLIGAIEIALFWAFGKGQGWWGWWPL